MAMFSCPKRDELIGKIIWYVFLALTVYGLISLCFDVHALFAQQSVDARREMFRERFEIMTMPYDQRAMKIYQAIIELEKVTTRRYGKLFTEDSLWIVRASAEIDSLSKWSTDYERKRIKTGAEKYFYTRYH